MSSRAPKPLVDALAESLSRLGVATAQARVAERTRARRAFIVEVLTSAEPRRIESASPAAALHDAGVQRHQLEAARAVGAELRVRALVDGAPVATVAHLRLTEADGALGWVSLLEVRS